MFKKHEKLFLLVMTVLFSIVITGLLLHRQNQSQNINISLSSISVPKSNEGITGGKININTADSKTLQLLPGIGPKMAERIIAHRDARGYFENAEDLMDVKGIGTATYNKVSAFITIGGIS